MQGGFAELTRVKSRFAHARTRAHSGRVEQEFCGTNVRMPGPPSACRIAQGFRAADVLSVRFQDLAAPHSAWKRALLPFASSLLGLGQATTSQRDRSPAAGALTRASSLPRGSRAWRGFHLCTQPPALGLAHSRCLLHSGRRCDTAPWSLNVAERRVCAAGVGDSNTGGQGGSRREGVSGGRGRARARRCSYGQGQPPRPSAVLKHSGTVAKETPSRENGRLK